jgi:hypothetical protein
MAIGITSPQTTSLAVEATKGKVVQREEASRLSPINCSKSAFFPQRDFLCAAAIALCIAHAKAALI